MSCKCFLLHCPRSGKKRHPIEEWRDLDKPGKSNSANHHSMGSEDPASLFASNQTELG